jgi:hypothetical protein
MTDEPNIKSDEPNIKSNERLDTALRIIGVRILVLFVAAFLVLVFTDWIQSDVRSVVIAHSGAIVVLPAAGVFALLVSQSSNSRLETSSSRFLVSSSKALPGRS